MLVETPPGIEPRLHAAQGRGGGAHRPRLPRGGSTPTPRSAASSGAVDSASVYVKLVPKAERERSQEAVGQQLRGDVLAARRRHHLGVHRLDERQLQADPDRAARPDSAELTRLAERMLPLVRQVPGAVDVGLSTRGQKPELEVELRARPRRLAGTLGRRRWRSRCTRPSPASTPATGSTPRARPATSWCGSRPRRAAAPPTWRGCRSRCRAGRPPTSVPLGQVATIREGLGPAAINHLDTERVVIVQANVSGRSLNEVIDRHQRRAIDERAAAAGLPRHPGRRGQGPGRGVRQDLRRARHRRGADVPHPGDAVRLVPRPARHHAVAAAVAHRRRAGAAHHRRHAQHHEPDRRDPAVRHRGQERHPAHRLREVGAGSAA